MKLTAAQQKIMDQAKADITFARTHTLIEWATEVSGWTDNRRLANLKAYRADAETLMNEEIARYAETYSAYYEREKEGIVLTQCNSRTLKKLECIGMIEIIKDGRSHIDTIKVLNF